MNSAREKILKILDSALQAVDPERAVRDALTDMPLRQTSVVAIGKAACGMMRGAAVVLDQRFEQGLVICSEPYLTQLPSKTVIALGSHPIPDEKSLEAGKTLLDFIQQRPEQEPILFLISGGASAMVEVLGADFARSDLERVNQWLLASGMPIGEINTVRKGMSQIKGGGILSYLDGRPVSGLFISDVIGDDPADIGSGLLSSDSMLSRKLEALDLPDWLRPMLSGKAGDESKAAEKLQVIASNRIALEAAARQAEKFDIPVMLHEEMLQGAADAEARSIVAYLKSAPSGIHLWGGETTVLLPDDPGRGGRNQHFALTAATEIKGHDDIWILSAGSDGIDGISDDAGALVDGDTIHRGESAGLNTQSSLMRADSGVFLDESGDLIHTGATGTNVMDLVIAMKE